MRVGVFFVNRIRIFAILIPLFSLFIPFHPLEARGKLIKGESTSSVYYISGEERFVFPNEQIFKSWYEDFDDVETIDDEQLADYTLGGNVTYRPGTRLVKLTNNPKVYAVEPGGILRWVTSETIALSLYGEDWASRVDDLADGFFTSYEIGNDLEDAVYPDGTLLEIESAYYFVHGGELHELSETGISRNGVLTSHAISVTSVDLPEGDSITREASYLSDTAEIGLGEDQENDVVGEERSIDTTLAAGTDDAVIGSFVVSIKTETIMQKVSLLIEAKTNVDDDADAGGLIRGDGDEDQIEANLKNIRVTDLAGNELFDSGSLKTSSDDDAQTVVLTGSQTLKPGRYVFQILADLDEDAPVNEKYQTTFYLSATEWMVKGEESEYATPEKVQSDTFTIVEGSIDLARDGAIKSTKALHGETDLIDIFGFTLSSSQDQAVTIDRIVLTGYIDAGEDDDDFVAGTDTDNQADFSIYDVIKTVFLVRVSDDSTESTHTIDSDGKVVFDGLDWSLAAGAKESFVVQVELEEDVPTGSLPDRVAFDISSTDEVDVTDSSAHAIEISGEAINGGTSPKSFLTIRSSGTLTISGSGTPDEIVVMGDEDVEFYSLSLAASDDEDMIIDTLYLRFLDQDSARDVTDARIRVGTTDYDGSVTVGGVIFKDMDLTVPSGETMNADVLLDLASTSDGAVSGDSIGLEFEPTSFSAMGSTSKTEFEEDDIGDTVTDKTKTGTSATLLRNHPTVALVSGGVATTAKQDDETEVMRFTLVSTGEGTSQVNTLTFKIETNEEGTDRADNDLFEKWAEVNGDSQDDNELVTLSDETSGTDELAEGEIGHIDFSLYDASAKTTDTTPSGLETGNGDYGILLFTFDSPLTIYATAHTYQLSLNTEGIAGKSPTIKATILGGDNFVWDDGSGSDDQNGDVIEKLPVAGSTIKIEI